jgi:hypothetical protein
MVMRDQDNHNMPGSQNAHKSACYHQRKETKQDPMDIDNKVVFGVENKITYLDNEKSWTQQTRAKDLELMAGKRVGFEATSPRFNINQVFFGQSLKID